MGVKVSIGTGNFTAAGTWGVVDSTSYLNDENATESLLTTAYSGTRSSAFTPGAITISHIGVKLCERIGTTGTISVNLEKDSDDSQVAGTEVTINVADLPSALEADLNGGWIFFKLASPVTLAGATAYQVAAKTSNASQVDLWCNGVADNLARALVTTTTGAPGAGDDLIVAGEKTGAGTENNFVVTMDSEAATDYGAASTSLITPAIAICSGGTLRSAVVSAKTYLLKVSGHIIVYSEGSLELGTTGSPMPRDSSLTLTLDSGTNVDFGLTVRNGGTFISQGQSRTSGKNFVSCKLNTDEAANSTSLGVDTDTGWLDNDVIAVASTSRTSTESESGALNGAAGASSLTVDGFAGAGGGLAAAHSGTSPTQAEVILLTRNVVIQGASATLQAYIDIKATATVDCDWTEFKWLGSATANKRGIDTACTTGTQSFQYCSLHNFEVASSRGLNMSGATGTGLTFSNNVTYLIADQHFVNAVTTGSMTVDSNIFIRNTTSSSILVQILDVGITFTNNTCISATGAGLILDQTGTFGTISGITVHSCASSGVALGTTSGRCPSGNLSTFSIWRCNAQGLIFSDFSAYIDITLTDFTLFGNSSFNIRINDACDVTFVNLVTNGDTTFSTTDAINVNTVSAICLITFINCDFSTVAGIKTAHTNDFNFNPSVGQVGVFIKLINTKLGGTNEIASGSQVKMSDRSFISSQKHDQTAGSHKTLKRNGTITIETTTKHTGGQSVKLTPLSASLKLESPSFFVAVANGASVTPTVYVYEDAAYNGARARLIVKRNDALGITSDTVLDTATINSDEAWEGLTGATASVTDDGVLEFVVDCDGTAGNLFVDSITVA